MSNVISGTGAWVIRCVATRLGRPSDQDRAIAAWLDTYELTQGMLDDVPLPGRISEDEAAAWIFGPDIQAIFHELIALELAGASSAEINQVRKNLYYAFLDNFQDLDQGIASRFTDAIFDVADFELKQVVGRIESTDPEFQTRVREEAQTGRLAALMEAIARHTDSNCDRSAEDRVRDREYLARYRQITASEHGFLEPPDFERRRRIPIQDLYVVPDITRDVDEREQLGHSPRIDLWQLDEQSDRAVLLGDPGGGKSTTASVLINRLSRNKDERIPFLVILREYAKEDPPAESIVGYLENRLETHYQCPAPSGLVERLLLSGKAIVFFDGLDELVDTGRRREVTQRVENFSRYYPQTPVVVTSRRIGYKQAQLDPRQFTTFQLAPFTSEQTIEYARKWFAQERRLGDQEAPEWAESFARESATVPDLRSNPLMLALLCILYRGEGSLPRNRPAVYERCSTLLFETWDASRNIYVNLRARDLVEPVLRYLAHWLLTRDIPSPVVTEDQLINETARYLQDRRYEDIAEATRAAREFVDFCKGRAWVFTEVGTSAGGDPLFTFSHRTFLEYFAAAYLASVSDTPERLASELGSHIVRQEWDVVAELALQIKSRQIQDGAARFYTALLSNRRYTAASSLRNLTSFLARCLNFVDVPPLITRELVDRSLDYFKKDPLIEEYCVPLGQLMSVSRVRDTVHKRLSDLLSEMIRNDDSGDCLIAMRLMMNLSSIIHSAERLAGSSRDSEAGKYWHNQGRALSEANKEQILANYGDDKSLQIILYLSNWIGLRHIAGWPETPWRFLFENRVRTGIGISFWIEPAASLVSRSVKGPQHPDFGLLVQNLEEVMDLIRAIGPPPWPVHFMDRHRFGLFADKDRGSAPEDDLLDVPGMSLNAWVAALILAATLFESDPARDNIFGQQMGYLNSLAPYMNSRSISIARKSSDPELPTLPPLRIPDSYQELFNGWAVGEFTFIKVKK